jgi:hypothetical protein
VTVAVLPSGAMVILQSSAMKVQEMVFPRTLARPRRSPHIRRPCITAVSSVGLMVIVTTAPLESPFKMPLHLPANFGRFAVGLTCFVASVLFFLDFGALVSECALLAPVTE